MRTHPTDSFSGARLGIRQLGVASWRYAEWIYGLLGFYFSIWYGKVGETLLPPNCTCCINSCTLVGKSLSLLWNSVGVKPKKIHQTFCSTMYYFFGIFYVCRILTCKNQRKCSKRITSHVEITFRESNFEISSIPQLNLL